MHAQITLTLQQIHDLLLDVAAVRPVFIWGPPGSIIIGAGNRAHDAALAMQMPSALVNRMVHVHLRASHREWLAWAEREGISPDHLDALLFGSLSRDHAVGFKAFLKQIRNQFSVHRILKGEQPWPSAAEDRDLTYFLTLSLRDLLIKELPEREGRLGRVAAELGFRAAPGYGSPVLPRDAYCQVDAAARVYFDSTLELPPAHWLGIFSLATLVFAIGGLRRLPVPSRVSDLAVQIGALHWWRQLRIGELPEHFELPAEILQWGRQPIEDIAARLNVEPPSEILDGRWTLTRSEHPLLGSLLAEFELVEDADLCERLRIGIAAIQVGTKEIYLSPRRSLGLEQAKFVLAHEILHAGLNHAGRRQGRDPYLWNVACDFVINDWLVTMNLGIPPEGGLLFDEALRGLPAEDIYLKLAADLRVRRRLSTFRGDDVDMLDDGQGKFFTDREEFCRRALLPAGLEEAIRTLNQPAIAWQAKLAEWIQERCPLPERRRTWAKPSRRQSATPDTPRPRFIEPDDERATRTYGVIVDTSGSMDRADLGKALGAIVAYSQAQGVKQVRLVYCDAQPYDEGYVPVDSLASRVRVRGRGGTVLLAAVNLLQGQKDFAGNCPILIITDGLCEPDLQVARDHAFLVSPGMRLPFPTRKPVFQMR